MPLRFILPLLLLVCGTAFGQGTGGTGGSGGSSYVLPIATSSTLGGVKPDGVTQSVNGSTGVNSSIAFDSTKSSSYQVANDGTDMGKIFVLGGTGATLTLQAESATNFSPGQSICVIVTASGAWTLANNTGLTLSNFSGTSLGVGTSGCFVANQDGTHLDFFGVPLPLAVAQGGTGTTAPGLVAGANVTITGVWPNQTVASSGGGGGGLSVLRSYLAGVQLSNDGTTPTTKLDISAGTAADSANASMISIGAFIKTVSGTWVSGSGNAGMGSGGGGLTVAATTWYHVCLATISAAADIFFDTDVNCVTHQPASTTAVRRIGSFFTDSSAHIVAFSQNGDEFLWLSPFQDANGTSISSTRTLVTLTVPTGIKVNAKIRGEAGSGLGAHILISSPDETAVAAQATTGNADAIVPVSAQFIYVGESNPRTNTSAQIGAATAASETGNTLYIATYGWIDRRGRDN